MNKKFLVIMAVFIGIAFLILAIVYWTVEAQSLPHFLPGFEAGVTKIHFKHGLASLLLALALFAFAWFKSGKSSVPIEQ